jgi:hypothetical protein
VITTKSLREMTREDLPSLTLEEPEGREMRAAFEARMVREMEDEFLSRDERLLRKEAEREQGVHEHELYRARRRDRDADCLAAAAENAQTTLAASLHNVGNESWELVPVFKSFEGVVKKLASQSRYLENHGAKGRRCEHPYLYGVGEWEWWGE